MLNWTINDDAVGWDDALGALPGCNLYQSYDWSRYRGAMGWRVVRAIGRDNGQAIVAMAQMLVRRHLGASVIWIPGGPAGDCRLWAASLPKLLRDQFGLLTYCRLNILREY